MRELENARILHESGNICLLIESYSGRAKSQFPELDYLLGDSLRQIGRLSDAEPLLQSASSEATGRTQFDAMVSYAFLLKESGRYEEALSVVRHAKSVVRKVPGWLHVLEATLRARLESFGEAITVLALAESSDDVDLDEVYLNLAYAFRGSGQYSKAFDYSQRVLELKSSLSAEAREIVRSLDGLL